jgi:hypothetical protein
MVVVDGQGISLGGAITSASPAEVKLAEETLETIKVPRQGRGRPKSRPKRLIGDKAYDSDKLRASLAGKEFASWSLTAETGKTKKRRPKSRNDTSIGGKSRGPSPGWEISADWLSAMNA